MEPRKIPDARWINRELDIRSVASELGIAGTRGRFHCWHPENHRNGDADPSVGYWREGNRLRCFVCDRPAIGVIDLVVDRRGVDVANAISWVAQRFEVPQISARKPHERDPQRRRLDNIIDPITFLVRSHIFSRLSSPARLLAPVLIALSIKEGHFAEAPLRVVISYKALMRYSGLKSPNAVSRGIEELKVVGWMRGGSDAVGPIKTTGSYVILPFAQQVIDLGHSLAKEEQGLIEHERRESKQRKQEREQLFRGHSRGRKAA